MSSRTALFLHWGPGSDASTERAWFGDRLPIRWWDQPAKFREPAKAFGEVVDAALAELRAMAAAQGGPVWVVAHSFGGQIARALAAIAPAEIAGLTLVACGANAVAPFANLGRALGRLGRSASTGRLASAFEDAPSPATFWPLMREIAATPGFFELYWSDPAARARHLALRPAGPSLDMDAFAAIINDRLTADAFARMQPPAAFPVICCLGEADPLQNAAEAELAWKSLFPGAAARRLAAAHFPHLETAPAEWAAEVIAWARGSSGA